MQKAVTDMTQGKPLHLIFRFSLPLIFGGLFQQFYMIVDSIIVGRGVGIQALASLGAADWINWLFLWGIHGFTQGFSVIVAYEFGAANLKALRKATAMIIKLCWIFGIVLTAVGLLLIDPLLRLLQTESAIFPGSQLYLQVLFAGTLVVIAYNMSAAILRCLGDSKTPLLAMAIAAAANIALDLLFVMVFHWGIFGAAFATVLAQAVSFFYCFLKMRKLEAIKLSAGDWVNDKAMMVRLCKMGAPVALQNAVISIGGMAVQYVLNGFGFLFVAGFTATNKLYGMLESAAIAFGYAMTAYMGQNRGARCVKRIDSGMRSVLILSAAFSVVISGSMMLWGKNILFLFVSREETDAEKVIEIAYHYLFIMSCLLIFLFLVHAYRSSLQGLGNTLIPMLSGFMELIMRVGAALVLPGIFGREGIFYAEVAAWAGAAILMMVYYYARIKSIKQKILSAP